MLGTRQGKEVHRGDTGERAKRCVARGSSPQVGRHFHGESQRQAVPGCKAGGHCLTAVALAGPGGGALVRGRHRRGSPPPLPSAREPLRGPPRARYSRRESLPACSSPPRCDRYVVSNRVGFLAPLTVYTSRELTGRVADRFPRRLTTLLSHPPGQHLGAGSHTRSRIPGTRPACPLCHSRKLERMRVECHNPHSVTFGLASHGFPVSCHY